MKADISLAVFFAKREPYICLFEVLQGCWGSFMTNRG